MPRQRCRRGAAVVVGGLRAVAGRQRGPRPLVPCNWVRDGQTGAQAWQRCSCPRGLRAPWSSGPPHCLDAPPRAARPVGWAAGRGRAGPHARQRELSRHQPPGRRRCHPPHPPSHTMHDTSNRPRPHLAEEAGGTLLPRQERVLKRQDGAGQTTHDHPSILGRQAQGPGRLLAATPHARGGPRRREGSWGCGG